MQSPLIIHQNLLREYQEYLLKQFKSKNSTISEGRKHLYEGKGITFQPPFLEFLFNYKKSGIDFRSQGSIDELRPYFNDNHNSVEKFRKLVGSGLVPYEVYQHQWNMLRKTILENKHSIITTGTGSGKTESFMLPLVAYLSKLLIDQAPQAYSTNGKFSRLDNGISRRRIAKDEANFRYLRENCTRQSAVKAIMLFPMNALVEDQLKRIRHAFSNPTVLDILDNDFNGNRVFYGKYNGLTPGTGDFESRQLEAFYNSVAENEKTITDYANSKNLIGKSRHEDALNYFGREVTEDGSRITGEMLNRYDMQNHPPDILITNFSMLNVMLTRSVEQCIWDRTAEWLKQEGSIFHVVLDELHLYRGSAGTEIAYSISALLERLGIAGKPEKVRFLASSASLDLDNDPQAVKNFIGGFFNVLPEEVHTTFHLETGETLFPVTPSKVPINVIKESFINLSKERDKSKIDNQTLQAICNSSFIDDLCHWYVNSDGANNRSCSIELLSHWLLQKFDITKDIENEVQNITSARPDILMQGYHIVDGFFLFRDYIDSKGIPHSLPRIRMHLLYNNFEGLWGSIKVGTNNKALFGHVFNYPKKIDDEGNKVYRLFYCEKCETSFIGGFRESGIQWAVPPSALPGMVGNQYCHRRITPSEVNLNSDSLKAVSTDTNLLPYRDFSIFWPENQESGKTYIRHIPEVNPRDRIAENIYNPDTQNVVANSQGYWFKAFFNPSSGQIRIPLNVNSPCPEEFIQGRQYIALDGNFGDHIYTAGGTISNRLAEALQSNESNTAKALSQCCPCCATKKYLTPIVRGYRTGFNKTNQLFASGLFKSLKNYNPTIDPKIVSFSDSRDEAAKVAAGVESQHFNELVTDYLLYQLKRREFTQEEKTQVLLEQANTSLEHVVHANETLIRETFDNAIIAGRMTIVTALSEELNLDDDQYLLLLNLYQKYKGATTISFSYTVNDLVGDFRYGAPITGLNKYLLIMGIDVRGVYNVRPYLENQPAPKQKWFEPLRVGNGINFGGEDNNIQNYYSLSSKFLKAYLLRLLFNNSIFDIESMGLGKLMPCYTEPAGFPHGHWDKFIYGLVKLMGWENKYTPRLLKIERRIFDDRAINPSQNLPQYIVNYINRYNTIKGTSIQNATILEVFSGNRVVLDFTNNNCPVRISALRDEDELIQCNQCSQVYSRKISYCLNCDSDSGFRTVPARTIREKSYTGSHIYELNDIHRFHCEELSGQTDEPFERQRNFLGLIKDEHLLKKAQEIDLLAVTTTLEVGVDIGNLQGMLMANMPPQRFNYQQRVGRVGRRGQAFSFAVTLCRSKSHDAHYFQHPDEITGDPSPTPFLNIEQPEILRRVLNKHFLAAFYRDFADYINYNTGADNWHQLLSVGDINGQFGKIRHTLPNPYISDGQAEANPESYFHFLDSFITDKKSDLENKYNQLLLCLKRNTITFNQSFQDYIANLKTIITTIVKVGDRSPEESLAKALMELGFLPSYGMPTKISYLYNNYPDGNARDYLGSNSSPESMDRTIDVAIFDYAPGSIKLKDKIEYTIKAIVPDVNQVNSFGNTRWQSDGSHIRSQMAVYRCVNADCGHFKLIPIQQSDNNNQLCDSCGENTMMLSDITAIEPRNFSIDPDDDSESDQANISNNNRLAISGLRPISWEQHNAELGNIKKTYSESDTVNYIYKINKGRRDGIPMGHSTIYQGVQGLSVNARTSIRPYWLYTRKNTDTLSFITHLFLNQRFNLCIENNIQANLEKKAVFLSAATILQRCFADILDIDPREVEFANPDFITVTINGQSYKTLQLTFYDSHDNGSGYVRRIQELLDSHESLLDFIESSKFYRNALVTDQHKASCISGSCYKCIRTYDNSSLHGLLDWRLGLDLIKFMSDADYEINFNEFQQYVLNIAGRSRFMARSKVDSEGNCAIELLDLGGTPRYLVTHPISRFDTSTYQTSNPGVETKSIYSLILTL